MISDDEWKITPEMIAAGIYAASTQMERYPKLEACDEVKCRNEIEADFLAGAEWMRERMSSWVWRLVNSLWKYKGEREEGK